MILSQDIDTPIHPERGPRKLIVQVWTIDAAGQRRLVDRKGTDQEQPVRLVRGELLDGQKLEIVIELEPPAPRPIDPMSGVVMPPL